MLIRKLKKVDNQLKKVNEKESDFLEMLDRWIRSLLEFKVSISGYKRFNAIYLYTHVYSAETNTRK